MSAPGYKIDPNLTGTRSFQILFPEGDKPQAVTSGLDQYQEGHPVEIRSDVDCILILNDETVFGIGVLILRAGTRILLFPKVLGKSTGWSAIPMAATQRWTGDPPGIPS